MKQYSKRAFIKLVGLGLITSPFLALYSSCNETDENAKKKNDNIDDKPLEEEALAKEYDESDIIVLRKNDEAFDNSNVYFNARVQKLPKVIALCFTNLGIQQALQLAKKEQLPIAIKSGGHSFEGFSNVTDGMVINVSNMKEIKWLDKNKVKIGAGCVLSEIHAALFKEQQIIPAGSCGSVGIAGLTLGGGYGFFSRKYGLTCDQVVDFEYINAKGEIKLASEDKEVLWAMKGGGNGNFGIVSSITFKTSAMPAKFAAHTLKFRNLNASNFETIAETWFNCYPNLNPEDFSAFVLNGNTLTILATTFGNRTNLARAIQPLIDISDKNTFADTPLPVAMKRFYGRNGPIYFKNASAGLYESFQQIQPILKNIFEKVIANKGIIYQINTLGGAINNENYQTNSCFPHRALPFLSELQAYWAQNKNEKNLLAGFQEIQQIIHEHGITAQYCNYPDINFKNWPNAYYGINYSKLQAIKEKIDPNNIFKYEQGIQI